MLTSSQFYVTFKATPNLDKKHTVFGKLVGGEDVLDGLEKIPLKAGTERPAKPVRIAEIVMCVIHAWAVKPKCSPLEYSYQDPFEDYKTRLAKKLAKRAEAEQSAETQNVPEKKEGDDINWFGMKVGTGNSAFRSEAVDGGVGKYLNLKRPLEAGGEGTADDGKKKRKTGFGDFDGW